MMEEWFGILDEDNDELLRERSASTPYLRKLSNTANKRIKELLKENSNRKLKVVIITFTVRDAGSRVRITPWTKPKGFMGK